MEIALHYRFFLDRAYRHFGAGNAGFNRNAFTATDLGTESRSVLVGVAIWF